MEPARLRVVDMMLWEDGAGRRAARSAEAAHGNDVASPQSPSACHLGKELECPHVVGQSALSHDASSLRGLRGLTNEGRAAPLTAKAKDVVTSGVNRGAFVSGAGRIVLLAVALPMHRLASKTPVRSASWRRAESASSRHHGIAVVGLRERLVPIRTWTSPPFPFGQPIPPASAGAWSRCGPDRRLWRASSFSIQLRRGRTSPLSLFRLRGRASSRTGV